MIRHILIANLFALAINGVNAQPLDAEPFVAVRGTATQQVIPDTFKAKIVLSHTSMDTAGTSALIEGLLQQFLEIAKEQGLPETNIEIEQLTIQPDFEWNETEQKRIFRGNTYSRELSVQFSSLDKLKAFVVQAPVGGQVQMTVGDFSYSKSASLRKTLLTKAIDDAKQTAILLAEGAGMHLGTAQTISTTGFGLPYSEGYGAHLDTISVSGNKANPVLDPLTVLKAGTLNISQDVYIVYRLVD